MKTVSGYVRHPETGAALSGKTVTLKAKGVNVPVGGTGGWSTNPTSTDVNGYFQFTGELSPGRLTVQADIDLSNIKFRSGLEMMQEGLHFASDFEAAMQMWTEGIIQGIGASGLTTIAGGTRTAVVQPFQMHLGTQIIGTDTNKSFTAGANVTLAFRFDRIVVQQYLATHPTDPGKQDIILRPGIAASTPPAINTDPNIKELSLGYISVANGSATGTWVDERTYAAPKLGLSSISPTVIQKPWTLTGNNVLAAFLAERVDGKDVFAIDMLADPDNIRLFNGWDIRMHSDSGATQTIGLNGQTGDVALASINTALTAAKIAFLATITSDVQAQLNAKAASVHTHVIADTTGLQAALDSKASSGHTHTTNEIFYDFDYQDNASNDAVGFSGYTLAMTGSFVLPSGTWDIWVDASMSIFSTAGGYDVRARSSTVNGGPVTKTAGENPANERDRAEFGYKQTGYVSNGVTAYNAIVEYQAIGSGTATGENPFIRLFAKRTA